MTTRKDPDRKRGVYSKYVVHRLADMAGKHDDCFYFVLDPKHDRFARDAMRCYAFACEEEYPLLAKDLNLIAKKYEP